MAFDPTTFALEVLNFLVLLWLLARFLYRPMKAALAARTAAFERQRSALEAARATLAAGQAELDKQTTALAREREAKERALAEEVAQRRQEKLAALDRELDAEREKARARREQDEARARQHDEREQRVRAAAYVGQYLRRLASPALEAQVIELFLADLAQQSEAARAALRGDGSHPEAGPAIDVSTAFAVPDALRGRVEARVRELAGAAAALTWRVDPGLLAGICVHLPGYSLEASLRRGVHAFAGDGEG